MKDLTCRKTERRYNLLGQTTAKNIALEDIREDVPLGSRYTGMLTHSVKEQLKCFNNVSVCSIDELSNCYKIIPEPKTLLGVRDNRFKNNGFKNNGYRP